MIDNLPNGWEIGFLNDKKTNEIKGSGIDKFDGNKNYLSTESIKNNKINSIEEIITYEKRPSRANLQPNFNDVFFAKMKDTEKVLKITEEIEEDYILSTGFMPIKPYIDKLNSDFLAHYFKSETFNLQKDRLSNGGTQKALNNGNAEKISIPIPPIQQQKRIVKVLDLTSNLIEKQKELLERYDLFLKSKFIEMFGDPITNPMGWEVEKLGNVIKLDAKMVQPNIPEYENLLHIGPDRIEKNTGKLLPALTAKEEMLISKKFFFTNEYILYSKIRPYLNKVAMPSFSGLCSADMYPIKPIKGKTNREYLWKLLLSSYFIKYTETLADRASIPKLNKKELVEFLFPLPPIELQNKFASIVEKIEIIKEKENQKLKQFEDLHNSMMNKAFKGEIQ